MEKTPHFHVQPFGGYYLLERIAVGGMAELFKAKQTGVRGFEKIVVIKKILHHLSSDPEFVEMFEDEAKIAAQLHHSNIVQIYELGEVDQTLYITMEYVDGKNVRDITKAISTKGIHLSVEQTIFLVTEVLKGLDYAHRKSDSNDKPLEIIHRDMSPQNIVVSYEGEVKILDFGIAKAASQISRTEAGVLKGKFSYMSPEQASGKRVTQHTDIYACGVILYELLTSKRLFRSPSDMETLDRVKAGKIPVPSGVNKDIPKELDKIILKALAKNINERYQSAGEFLSDLLAFYYSQKFNHSSQDLSVFMKTLFSQSIEDERTRLQEALHNVPVKETAPIENAKTHIAFKFDPHHDDIQKRKTNQNEALPLDLRETTVSTLPPKRSRLKILIFLLFLLGVVAALSWIQSEKVEKQKPSANQTKVEEKQDPQEPIPANELFENTPLNTEEVIKEGKRTAKDIFAEIPKPKLKPEEPQEKAVKNPSPIETSQPKPKPSPKPRSSPSFGIIDMIAPIEGFAKLYINNEDFGTVPGRKARGIKLETGTHFIRCETTSRIYSGKISLKKGKRLTIRCGELRN